MPLDPSWLTPMNCTSVLFLCTARTFWSGESLMVQMGPWSARRNVELCSSTNPREIMPVAPPERTENTCWINNQISLLSSLTSHNLIHLIETWYTKGFKRRKFSDRVAFARTWQFLSSKNTLVTRPTGSKVTGECRGAIREDAADDILWKSWSSEWIINSFWCQFLMLWSEILPKSTDLTAASSRYPVYTHYFCFVTDIYAVSSKAYWFRINSYMMHPKMRKNFNKNLHYQSKFSLIRF